MHATRENRLESVRRSFFEGYLARHPEEATTLGAHRHDERWSDLSPDALADTRQFFADAIRELEAIDRNRETRDQAIDHRVMHGLASFRVHAHDDELITRNLELSLAPYTTMQHRLAQISTSDDWARIGVRASAIPHYLATHAQNLLRGVERGRPVDRHVAQHFVDHQLPAAARFFDQLVDLPHAHGHVLTNAHARLLAEGATAAGAAFLEHSRVIRERVLPHTMETETLGEDEVRFRLQHAFGIEESIEALLEDARAVLQAAQREILRGTNTIDLESATAAMRALERAQPATDDDVFPLYTSHWQRARAFVQQRGIFHVPSSFEVRVRPAYPGMSEVGNVTNWPAPLRDRRAHAHVLLSRVAAHHSLLAAPLLAVHEGIPGHSLQSAWWQDAFADHEAPVRFLLVHDDMASAQQCFGTMLAVEGFATYVEDRLRRAGFYDEAGTTFAHVVRAIRAVRVIVDLGLATGRMSRSEAVAMLVRECCMDEENARRQVLRYGRIPLQAMTYLVGARAIEKLHDECRMALGNAFDEAAFHDALFSYGPVPPAWIAPHLLADLRGSQ